MAARPTYLMTHADVEAALTMAEALEVVEYAFRAYGEGKAQMPPKMYLNFEKGDLRCMPAYLPEVRMAAVKNVNVHPHNTELPTVMATLTLFDPETGFPLAVMEAAYLTAVRTGAAGGIAAKYLARPDSAVAGFVGAGQQARTQLEALMITLPHIREVRAYDANAARAHSFAEWCAQTYHINALPCALNEVVSSADVLTTVTPSRLPLVKKDELRPGTHINAIGADAPGKQELESTIIQTAVVVVDNWEQASHSGEINVPLAQGLISRDDIYADIGELVTGKKPGRRDPEQTTVFDSTGLAIQDAACAARVYTKLTSTEEVRRKLRTIDFFETP